MLSLWVLFVRNVLRFKTKNDRQQRPKKFAPLLPQKNNKTKTTVKSGYHAVVENNNTNGEY